MCLYKTFAECPKRLCKVELTYLALEYACFR